MTYPQNREASSMSFTHRISQLGSLSENAVGTASRTFLVSGLDCEARPTHPTTPCTERKAPRITHVSDTSPCAPRCPIRSQDDTEASILPRLLRAQLTSSEGVMGATAPNIPVDPVMATVRQVIVEEEETETEDDDGGAAGGGGRSSGGGGGGGG